MRTARRVRWCVRLVLVLLLASAQDTFARPRGACVTIRSDESAASVAKRLTGDARNVSAPWFQIVNPTTSRPVPKSRYGLRFAGWNACVVNAAVAAPEPPAPDAPAPSLHAVADRLPGVPVAAAPLAHPVTRAGSGVVTWFPVMAWCTLVVLLALGNWFVDEYLVERARRLRSMRGYAERFVQEFERPLVQQHLPERPIQSRVRFRPGRSRFDVLLAPQGGLRYPNLTDHKRNVMYDVVRIQRALSEHAFVSSRPYARGRWVVVPFKLRVDAREAGGE